MTTQSELYQQVHQKLWDHVSSEQHYSLLESEEFDLWLVATESCREEIKRLERLLEFHMRGRTADAEELSQHGLFARIGKHGSHHEWISRDYEDIDCKAIGCLSNRDQKCMTPSACNIGPDGRCEGFRARPLPSKIDGD